ncbi:MAG: heme-binding protein [Colwellia sp.]|nr:heme-binding protein [Colwellia sp.]
MLSIFDKSAAAGIILFFSVTALAQESASLMTYDLALKAIDSSEAYARKKGWNVTILVTDQNANPVMLRRLDGASIRSIGFAKSKALVVTKTGLTSGEYAEKLRRGEIDEIEGGVTYKGGVPVYLSGKLIGAVSTSGVKDFQDLEVSIEGVKKIGSISRKGSN